MEDDECSDQRPLIKTEECTFAYIKHSNLYVVATTRSACRLKLYSFLKLIICNCTFIMSGLANCQHPSSYRKNSNIAMLFTLLHKICAVMQEYFKEVTKLSQCTGIQNTLIHLPWKP